MKFKQYIFIVTVYFVSVILQSCTENVILPDLKGNLVGYIYTFDEFSQLLDDHSGILITALGITGEYHTFSDKNGRFEFKGLPAGTYELHFEKSGFGTLKQFGIKHLGGEPTILYMVFDPAVNGNAFFMYELPTTEITYLRIVNNMIYCECSFTKPEPAAIALQLYFSLQDNFDIQSKQYIIPSLRLEKDGGGYSSYWLTSTYWLTVIPSPPFKPGDKVYFRACASPLYYGGIGQNVINLHGRHLFGIDSYFDYENNQTVYPALGKVSAQFSFVFPE